MAAPSDKPVLKVSTAVVTLDVYSGRPNPTWRLSEPTTAELLRRLQTLDASKVQVPKNEDLGYRAVSAELQEQTKDVVVVTASRGIVTLDKSGEQFRYADPGRQFELWLVNTGADHLTPDILRYVVGEIASKLQ